MQIVQEEAKITDAPLKPALDFVVPVMFVVTVKIIYYIRKHLQKIAPDIFGSKFKISTFQIYFTKSKTLRNGKIKSVVSFPLEILSFTTLLDCLS